MSHIEPLVELRIFFKPGRVLKHHGIGDPRFSGGFDNQAPVFMV